MCTTLAAIARRHRTALVAGVGEASTRPGRAYNTLVAINADGPPGGRIPQDPFCELGREPAVAPADAPLAAVGSARERLPVHRQRKP
ncbi:hypothetical protein [Paenarthrobacter sp. PH39-S1]|uniref:hypothetical protein n=1 Tax=Paenarthrobacter sp. PH39-S1 TaxID=3046204 RepID=UPI0032D9A0F9